MSISAIEKRRRKMAQTGFVYLGLSLFCALFGAVYEGFSHGVYSYFMIYAFGFPLAGGALPFFALAFSDRRPPGRAALNLYHSGIAAMTVGSLFEGVLEIYGTTNRLVAVYWMVGGLLWGCALFFYLIGSAAKSRSGEAHRALRSRAQP